MACAVATDESLGIEYDEGTVCDICRDVSQAPHTAHTTYSTIGYLCDSEMFAFWPKRGNFKCMWILFMRGST